jgi:YHYH protein
MSSRRRRALAGGTLLGLVFSAMVSSSGTSMAHTLASPSTIALSDASTTAPYAAYTGTVSSSSSSCLAKRTVTISFTNGDGQIAYLTGKTISGGSFILGGAAPREGTMVTAAVAKRVLKNTADHRHVCKSATSAAVTPSDAIDITELPVGDDMFSSSPKRDYLYSCQTEFTGGGASTQGPWFNGDGTWDLTEKATVDGSVDWPYEFTVTIQNGRRIFTGNGYPDHPTGTFPIAQTDDAHQYDANPHGIEEQTVSIDLPASPTKASSPTCAGGSVGIMLSGGPLFNGFDAGGRDAVAWEVQDSCDGHPQSSGQYHYHSLSACAEGDTTGAHSELYGYALDGFGIYGRYGVGGVVVTNDVLDTCHGHTHSIEWDGSVRTMYHYHATYEFPYTVACYRGTPIQAGTGAGDGAPGDGGAPSPSPGGSPPPGGGGPPPPPPH